MAFVGFTLYHYIMMIELVYICIYLHGNYLLAD